MESPSPLIEFPYVVSTRITLESRWRVPDQRVIGAHMAIWVLRFVLICLGVLSGATVMDRQPAWLPSLDLPVVALAAVVVMALGIAAATFVRREEARNHAMLVGWALCVAVIVAVLPQLAARWG
jgi:hypothetical protein